MLTSDIFTYLLEELKKYINSAISLDSIAFSLLSPGEKSKLSKKLVLTIPGFIIVALIKALFTSSLKDLKKPNNPCLAAQYKVPWTPPILEASDPIKINIPFFLFFNVGESFFAINMCDMRLSLNSEWMNEWMNSEWIIN